jgi:IS1 family transposase
LSSRDSSSSDSPRSSRSTASVFFPADQRGCDRWSLSCSLWLFTVMRAIFTPAYPVSNPTGAMETYVKVAGRWRYVYRAIDQFGQVIDVFVTPRRDATAAHRCFQRAVRTTKVTPAEVTTDKAPVYPGVLEELLPAAWHRTDRYANNRVQCDHGRLKARLRPMRGLNLNPPRRNC